MSNFRNVFVKDDEQARKLVNRLMKRDMPEFHVTQHPVEWVISIKSHLVGNPKLFKDIDWS